MGFKRLCILLLVVVLTMGLCSCGTNKEEKENKAAADVKDTTEGKSQFATGYYVTFGSYPQSKAGNDDTPIEWLVLDSDGETALLISRYALDRQRYGYNDNAWEQSTLRSWLNNEFYNKAFSAEEKRYILQNEISENKNAENSANSSSAMKDDVFLLSMADVNKYLGGSVRKCAPTDYAIERGASTDKNNKVDGRRACSWWLCTPASYYSARVRAVDSAGYIDDLGFIVYDDRVAVRPSVRV